MVRDHPVGEPELERRLRVDAVIHQKHLGGAAEPDQGRQQPAHGRVTAGDADPREEELEPGALGEQAQVTGHRQHGTGPGGEAVDGGNHRLRQPAQVADAGAGDLGEVVDVPRVGLAEAGQDELGVAARAEARARAAEDDDPHLVAAPL